MLSVSASGFFLIEIQNPRILLKTGYGHPPHCRGSATFSPWTLSWLDRAFLENLGWTGRASAKTCACATLAGRVPGTVGRRGHPRTSIHEHLCTVDSDVVTVREMLYSTVQYTHISPFIRNLTPKKYYMNGHLISSMFPDHNCMGIPVKKRYMNAMHPLSI